MFLDRSPDTPTIYRGEVILAHEAVERFSEGKIEVHVGYREKKIRLAARCQPRSRTARLITQGDPADRLAAPDLRLHNHHGGDLQSGLNRAAVRTHSHV
jgi:hypothetical protein